MKKRLLTVAVAVLGTSLMAQINGIKQTITPAPSVNMIQQNFQRCATPIPAKHWDEWFNARVEEFKKTLPAGKASATTYTIPIVFHIIYNSGEAVGTGHNVSQTQVNSQVPILNADYAGTGYNSSNYATMTLSGQPAFKQYATANSLPAPDNNGVIMANAGITFCLATKNPTGGTLAEPGIDRRTWQSVSGATNPANANQSQLQSLFDNTIKPATIWDVTKYFNVWVSDGGTSGLLGYATFPAGSGLSGLSGTGTATTDGVWMSYQGLGNTGTAAAPYNKGRTLVHEAGHWLGLRHIWGDGTCATDYCLDTPPAASANFVAWPTAYPYNVGTCTGPPSNSPCGEMFMNFMDYSDDAAMWMFTTDQVTRIQTAMSNSPNRSGLTSSAANLCNISVSTPTAAFTPPSSICSNVATVFTDASSGPPTAWNWSVLPSAGVTITTNTVSNPSITFPSAGTYTVTDAVSNSAGSSSISHTVSVTSCTLSACDTLSNITSTDTCTYYRVTNGYLSGSATLTTTTTTTYQQKAIGELYYKTSFPSNITQVKGAMILFYKNGTKGTKGTSTLTLNMVNNNAGVPGTTVAGTQTLSLSNVVTTTPVTGVDYAGSQAVTIGPYMLPYKVTFASPVTFSADFFLTLTTPTNTDTIVVYSGLGNHNAVNTAAIQLKPNTSTVTTWYAVNNVFSENFSFAIIPIACPATSGIEHNELGSNISLFPNPSNGNFNFAITLPEASTLHFTVVNTLGQSVFATTEHVAGNAVITYDLSTLGKGVYFVNITDNKNNKTVKKIIID